MPHAKLVAPAAQYFGSNQPSVRGCRREEAQEEHGLQRERRWRHALGRSRRRRIDGREAAKARTIHSVGQSGSGGGSPSGSGSGSERRRRRDEAEDEVEAILDVQNDVAGNLVYLIKWKGQDESQNTWEPEAHLTNCSELLAGFRERRRNARLIKIKMPTAPAGASSSSADAKAGEKVPLPAGGARTPFRIKLRVGSNAAAADADADEFDDIEDDDVDEYLPARPLARPSLSSRIPRRASPCGLPCCAL